MNPNFRHPNDNRENNNDPQYPSQNLPSTIQKGPGYYPNDNKGHYANSNRESLSKVDLVNKEQAPNSNFKIS